MSFESLILGIVQGLTEFLPVSSSGHLALLQNLWGITENSLTYDLLLLFISSVSGLLVLFPLLVVSQKVGAWGGPLFAVPL